jgi:hypothetical protein
MPLVARYMIDAGRFFSATRMGLKETLTLPGASLSVAICRIALFYATLQSLLYLDGAFVMWLSSSTFNSPFVWTADLRGLNYYQTFLTRIDGTPWVPKGLVKLFFTSGPPSPAVMYGIMTFAYVSTLAALVGLFTHISAVCSVMSVLLVSSIFTSWGGYWSHGFNVVHLAGLAFMFGRSGDRLSVDALINRLRGKSDVEASDARGDYRWPVVMGELAVHMFLFAAFWSKYNNGGGFMWALSDNLRNSLAVTWGVYRSSPPPILDFVMSHLWAFRFVGLAQLLMQGITIISCLLVRFPLWRALIGGAFMTLEIIGLGVLFEFWHWNWLPLVAFSIDWDRLWRCIKTTAGLGAATMALQTPKDQTAHGMGRWLGAYLALFFAYYVANFVFQLGEKHLNYPFSSMAFFSENRSVRPYRTPSDWSEFRGQVRVFEGTSDIPIALAHTNSGLGELSRAFDAEGRIGAMRSIVSTSNTGFGWCLNKDELQKRGKWKDEYASYSGQSYEQICGQTIPKENLRSVELLRSIAVVPARPEPPLPMKDVVQGLIGIFDKGEYLTLGVTEHFDPASNRWYLKTESRGLEIEAMEVLYIHNVNSNRHYRSLAAPKPLRGEWIKGSFLLAEEEHITAAIWTLVKVKDRTRGEIVFWGPVIYPYARGSAAAASHGKPIER